MKDCILQGKGILLVFKLDGTCFKLRKNADVMVAREKGVLNDNAYSKYVEGYEQYLMKHLTLMKNNSMNECRYCEMRYHVRGNVPGNCSAKGVHEPLWDFGKDPENVLNCGI